MPLKNNLRNLDEKLILYTSKYLRGTYLKDEFEELLENPQRVQNSFVCFTYN